MNTTSFEVTLSAQNKDAFIEWMKANDGPNFYECESHEYFRNNEAYKEYYAERYDNEACVFTVVSVCVEATLENLICKAAKELDIHLKFIVFYQDPGTGEASGGWSIL